MMTRSSSVSHGFTLCLLLGLAGGCKTKLPSDWPSGMPTYPNGTIMSATKWDFGDTLVQRTSDAPEKVREFYQTKLAGMRLGNSLDNGVVQSLTWYDDARPLQVTLQLGSGDGGKVTFATLQVTHVAKAGAASAAISTSAPGQAGTAAH